MREQPRNQLPNTTGTIQGVPEGGHACRKVELEGFHEGPDQVPSRDRHTLPQLYRLGLKRTRPPPVVRNFICTHSTTLRNVITADFKAGAPCRARDKDVPLEYFNKERFFRFYTPCTAQVSALLYFSGCDGR